MKKDVIRRKAIEPKTTTDHEIDARDGGVQSVDRALSIIETLAEDDEGYRLSDLAIRTGLSTSTVHRLLGRWKTAASCSSTAPDRNGMSARARFTVGATFARRRNFSAQAVPYLRKLRDLTRETANLAVVDDEFIVVLTRMESREIMRSLTKVGGRVADGGLRRRQGGAGDLFRRRTSAPSSAITACRGCTEKSIVRPGDLFKELEKIRRQGFAIDDEEACMGLRCIAGRGLQRLRRAVGRDFRLGHDQPPDRRAAAAARPDRAGSGGGIDGGARRRDAGGETGLNRACGPSLPLRN